MSNLPYPGTTLASWLYSSPSNPGLGISGLSSLASVAPLPTHQWFYLVRRFSQLLENLSLLPSTLTDGAKKQASVTACLNRYYWGHASETMNSDAVGSWGKQTQSRPSADIDLMFMLPGEVWRRFEQRTGNKQSQLLQELRAVLGGTFSRTELRGDGQVVIVKFDTIPVEVVPAFTCADGSIIICDTNDGGRYKTVAPAAEIKALNVADAIYNNNARALAKMAKRWRYYNSVPIKSFQLERLAIDFLTISAWSKSGLFYYDWIVRDFFLYLIDRQNTWISMPGTSEAVYLGSDWRDDAQEAYIHACTACEKEEKNQDEAAGRAWQEIFGASIPVTIA